MRARKWIARVRVVESLLLDGCGFPVRGVVAALAVCPEPAVVMVFVARYAGRREAHPSARQIFIGKMSTLRGRDVFRQVAVATSDG